jgi:hypothetical protein
VQPQFAPPGTEFYAAKRGESVGAVARQYLKRTSYLTSGELSDAIRKANGNRTGNNLKAGEQLIVPGILSAPVVEKTIPVAKDFEVRAIYLTGVMAGSDHGIRIIKHWREVGGNAVVFDIKDSDGSVNIPFDHPLAGRQHVYIRDVPKLAHFLHSQGMHAIARIAIFRDQRLVETHPELAVQSHRTGQAWRENGKLVWTDTSNPKVQEYNIALAKYVADLGVDEIQFDYVRFPSDGDLSLIRYPGVHSQPMSWTIPAFTQYAAHRLHPLGARVSVDVFGLSATQDLGIGQLPRRISRYVDAVYPMVYPSHYTPGEYNLADPNAEPGETVSHSLLDFQTALEGRNARLTPWLQDFSLGRTYTLADVRAQVRAVRLRHADGFLLWNAEGRYNAAALKPPA